MADETVTDPLGRCIRFTDSNWRDHVMKRHPEAAPYRRLAELAVIDPLEIRRSPSDPDCRLFYGRAHHSGVMIVTVANVVHGFVKTAHFVKSAKGDLEWSRPKP